MVPVTLRPPLIVSPPPTCSLPTLVICPARILPETVMPAAYMVDVVVRPPVKTSELNANDPPTARLPPTNRFPVVESVAALMLPLVANPAADNVPVDVRPAVNMIEFIPLDPVTAKLPPTELLPVVLIVAVLMLPLFAIPSDESVPVEVSPPVILIELKPIDPATARLPPTNALPVVVSVAALMLPLVAMPAEEIVPVEVNPPATLSEFNPIDPAMARLPPIKAFPVVVSVAALMLPLVAIPGDEIVPVAVSPPPDRLSVAPLMLPLDTRPADDKVPVEVNPPVTLTEFNPIDPATARLPPIDALPVVVRVAVLILPLFAMPAEDKVPVEVNPPVTLTEFNPIDPATARLPPIDALPVVVSVAVLILPLLAMPAEDKVPVEVNPPVKFTEFNPIDPATARLPPIAALPVVVSVAALMLPLVAMPGDDIVPVVVSPPPAKLSVAPLILPLDTRPADDMVPVEVNPPVKLTEFNPIDPATARLPPMDAFPVVVSVAVLMLPLLAMPADDKVPVDVNPPVKLTEFNPIDPATARLPPIDAFPVVVSVAVLILPLLAMPADDKVPVEVNPPDKLTEFNPIDPATARLPPIEAFPVVVSVAVLMLPLLAMPAADIVPVAVKDCNEVSDVMLDCAPVESMPLSVPALTSPATVMALNCPVEIDAMVPGDNVPLNVPPMIVPETVKLFKVPSDVMFGCAAVTMFPLMLVEEIAVRLLKEVIPATVPAESTPLNVPAFTLAAITVPVTVILLKVPGEIEASVPGDNVPLNVPPMMVPETVKLFKVPSDVMFGCAAVTMFPLMFAAVIAVRLPNDVIPAILPAESTPLSVPAFTFAATTVPATVILLKVPVEIEASVPGDNVPLNVPPTMVPETVKLFKVPSDVMFGCAAVTMFPLMVVDVIAVRLPNDVIPAMLAAESVPFNVPAFTVAAVTVPETVILLNVPVEMDASVPGDKVPLNVPPTMVPETVNVLRIPSDVIFGCAGVTILPLIPLEVIAVKFPNAVIPASVPADNTPLILPIFAMPVTVIELNVFSPVIPAMVPGDNTPLNVPPLMVPVTVRFVSVPTEVIFGCAAVIRSPANCEAVILPVTVNRAREPTDVILGWAAV
jgi:hypothetical protein